MPKKKQTKEERRQTRLRKGRQWALAYEGSHIVRDRRKRSDADNACDMNNFREVDKISLKKRGK